MFRLKGQSFVRILRRTIQAGLALSASWRHPESANGETIFDSNWAVKKEKTQGESRELEKLNLTERAECWRLLITFSCNS
jgi:hypothetical protein